MAKFIVEVDSDKKTIKITKDGEELNVDSFSISSYNCDNMDGSSYDCVCTTYSIEQEDGISAKYSLHFDTNNENDAEEGNDEYGMGKQIVNAHMRLKASNVFAKVLNRKK